MKNNFLRVAALILAILLLGLNYSFAGEPQGNASSKEIIEQAYKNAGWDNLSLEIRQVKFEAQPGFVPLKLHNPQASGQSYYVSPNAEFNLKDIVAMDVFYRPLMAARGTLGIKIYLKAEAAARLKDYSGKHINGFVGVILNGKLRNIVMITKSIETNSLNLGEFSVKEALDILNKFYKPLKPMWRYFLWS
jgi:hypothetical protein